MDKFCYHLLQLKMILFFDTETTGLPSNLKAPVTDLGNWPRMVSIAWLVYDNEGNKISGKEYVVKPEGYTIPNEVTKIHGISTEFAAIYGADLLKVIKEFGEVVNNADYLVAHNMDFDEKVVGAEFIRKHITNHLEGKNKICTKESATDYCALPGNKWPSLKELHYKLFNTAFEDAHNASVDIAITAKCFWELKRKEIIKLKSIVYDKVGEYSEGFAAVRKNDKWGFIDNARREIVQCNYKYVEDFSGGYAKVIQKVQWVPNGYDDVELEFSEIGLINKKGMLVIPCLYDDVKILDNGLIEVSLNHNKGYLHNKIEGYFYFDKSGDKYYWKDINEANNFIKKLAEKDEFQHSNKPLIEKFDYPDLIPYSKNWNYGYCTKDKKIVIDCIYYGADRFYEGLARVWVHVEGRHKFGFVDKSGKQVIPCIYDWADDYSEGLAKVKVNTKMGFIDKDGNQIIPCIYDSVASFSDSLAAVVLNDHVGYIDKKGNQVIPCIYGKYYYGADSFSEGLAVVELNGKHGFIDKTGKQIIPCIYDNANRFSEGLAGIQLNGKWGFIDRTGSQSISNIYGSPYFRVDEDGITSEGLVFSEGLAAVELNGKYGYIDKNEILVIPCIYDDATMFSGGLAAVKLKKGYGWFPWGFINKTGKLILPFIYSYVERRYKEPVFSKGLAKVNSGYIDKNGVEYWEDDRVYNPSPDLIDDLPF